MNLFAVFFPSCVLPYTLVTASSTWFPHRIVRDVAFFISVVGLVGFYACAALSVHEALCRAFDAGPIFTFAVIAFGTIYSGFIRSTVPTAIDELKTRGNTLFRIPTCLAIYAATVPHRIGWHCLPTIFSVPSVPKTLLKVPIVSHVITQRQRRSLRYWEKHYRRGRAARYYMNCGAVQWKSTLKQWIPTPPGPDTPPTSMFELEQCVMMIYDFMRLECWSDYVAAFIRIHHILHPGVSVSGKILEELLYLKLMAGFADDVDPFASINRSSEFPHFTNCAAIDTFHEGVERVSAWHEALMRTNFGRSMAMLLQGLLASTVLSQSRAAIDGVAWAHLLLGQSDIPPPKNLNMASLVEWGLAAISQLRELRDLILPAVATGDPSRIFDPGDRLTQATVRVKQALASQAEYLDDQGVHFDPQGWVDELEACEEFVLEMLRDKSLKHWDQSAFRKLVADLTAALVAARKQAIHLQCRKQPFFIMAVGAPGVGKTDNIEMVGYSCLMKNGDIIPSKHTYQISGTVKFHDTYNGNEPIVRVEDPTLSVQQEFDPLQFVSMLKSRYPYAPNMAAVELKNTRFACPKILMLTTNEENPALNRQKPESAFARRIDVHAEFFVNPQFEDRHGIGLDGDKIEATPNGDYYRVKIAKWVVDPNMRGHCNPSIHLEYETGMFDAKGKPVYTANEHEAFVFTPLQFNERVSDMYVRHVEKEKKALLIRNARKDQVCSKCRVAWGVHGDMECPNGGIAVTYDNPALRLKPNRWHNAMAPLLPESVRPARIVRRVGDFLSGFAAIATRRELRGAGWRLLRGRADAWDMAAVGGSWVQPGRADKMERFLALRNEPWFRMLASAAAFSAAAFALSKLAPLLFNVAPTATCNVYVGGAQPDVWKNAGPVVSRVPWAKPLSWPEPPRSKRVKGTNLEAIQKDIDERMVRILYAVEGQPDQNAVGIRIGGSMVLTHRHAFEFMRAKSGGLKSVTMTGSDALTAHVVWVPGPYQVFIPKDGGDYVVFRVDALNPLPFFKFFAERGARGPFLSVSRLVRELAYGQPRVEWSGWSAPVAASDMGIIMGDVGIPTTRTWVVPGVVRSGDCCAPLLTSEGSFVGILTASTEGRPEPPAALYQGFDAVDFKEAHAALRGNTPIFDVNDDLDAYGVPGREPVVGDLADRSSLRRIPEGTWLNADVAGTLEGYHGARNQSGMKPTPMQPYVNMKFPHVAGKWGVPNGRVCEVEGTRMDPFDRMLGDMVGRSSQVYDPLLMEDVRWMWVRGLIKRIPSPSETLRAPLSACLNGDAMMKRVDIKTSSGFLGGGPKSEHIAVERDGNDVTYTLLPDSEKVWDALGESFEKRLAPHMLVRVFLKLNEVRPVEKIAAGGTRTINCVPFPLNLRVKSVFGRLSAYLQRYKVVTGIMIGLNSAGSELDEVLAGMNAAELFTPEMANEAWWADWDTKHQDLSLDRRLLGSAWRALIEIAEGLGADPLLVEEMYFWAYVLMMPRAVMKGGDMLDVSWNSSGHQFTTEVNSVAALLGYFYACALVVGVNRAFLELFVIVYGDDVLMRVSLWLRERMPPAKWVEGLREYGLMITPGSKKADDKGEYRALGDCTFLKRRISRVEVAPGSWVWTAALEQDSILKGLAWYEPSDRATVTTAVMASMDAPLNEVQQLCEIVKNAQFEWWAYGPEVFVERTSWLQTVARSVGLYAAIGWRTYEGITEDYYAGRYTTMSL
jgi:hypothetical protein